MYCEHCGAVISTESKFCCACGDQVQSNGSSQPTPQRDFARARGRGSSQNLQKILLVSIPALFVVIIALWFVSDSSKIGGSPSDVVKAHYIACNEGKYSEAQNYLAPEAQVWLAFDDITRRCNRETRKGNLQRVEITGADIRGEGGKVQFRLHYKDGTVGEDEHLVIKKGGVWKIGPGG